MYDDLMSKIFNTMCATNNKIILDNKKIVPVYAFLTKEVLRSEVELRIQPMEFKNTMQKEEVINAIKNAAITREGVCGYIIIYDSVATITDKKTRKHVEVDCCMRTIYTPTKKVCNMQMYRGAQLLDNKIIIGRTSSVDMWDAWNEGNIDLLLKK